MKATPVEETRYILVLSEKEAKTLLALVQNPLSPEESGAIAKLRNDIWNCLFNAGCEIS